MKTLPTLLLSLVAASCASTSTPRPEPIPQPREALRGAAGNDDLRTMLSEVASAKACALIKGQFRVLRAIDHRDTATGVLWIRDCKITNEGTRVAFELGGSGWTWADQTQKQAGAKFGVHQYVKFDVDAKLTGGLDVAYDRGTHVASLWFSPSGAPDVQMKTVGDVDVDREGVWAELLGAVGSAVGQSPDDKGATQAAKQGKQEMAGQLADGLSVTVDLCTGLSRMTLGRPPKGKLGAADAGETRRVPIEIHPGGLMVFAPQLAGDGMSIHVDSGGPVRVALACHAEGEAAAAAFLAGKDYEPKLLAERVVIGKADIKIGPQRCPVTVIARSAVPMEVTFDYQRPAAEIARSTGGALIRCAPHGLR